MALKIYTSYSNYVEQDHRAVGAFCTTAVLHYATTYQKPVMSLFFYFPVFRFYFIFKQFNMNYEYINNSSITYAWLGLGFQIDYIIQQTGLIALWVVPVARNNSQV